MAKVLFPSGRLSTPQAAGITRYNSPGSNVSFSANATEANREIVYESAGTISNLYINVLTNDRNASTLRVRKNAANGNESVSITASTTGEFEDTVNTDSLVAADKIAYSLATGTLGTTFTWTKLHVLFAATTDTVSRLVLSRGAGNIANNNFTVCFGDNSQGATEAVNQTEANAAGTLKNLAIYISANTRDGAATITTRIDGVNGTVTISISASSTGLFEDTTNSDSVTAGQLINHIYTLAGTTGTVTFENVAVDFVSTASKFLLGCTDPTETINAATTVYFPISGSLSQTTTETNVQGDAGVAFTASNLGCDIQTNTVTAASTLTTRINAAGGTLSASITASGTGRFEDNTNTDTIAAADSINYSLATGSTGTSLVIKIIDLVGSIAVAAVTATKSKLLLMGIGL